jgi:hypothetical protein
MTHRFFAISCALAVAVGAGACTSPSAATSTAAPPTAASMTESFSGAISQTGTADYPFTVAAIGSVQVSLTSVAPLATMAIGLRVGSWDGTSCAPIIATNDDARVGATALTGTAAAGSYCVEVFDPGNIPTDWSVSYTVQVMHP